MDAESGAAGQWPACKALAKFSATAATLPSEISVLPGTKGKTEEAAAEETPAPAERNSEGN